MKNKISYAAANAIASKVIERLSSSCVRIEVAGSLRRKAATVGDIEIMIVPEPELYDYLDNLLAQKKIRLTEPKRWGEKFRSFMMTTTGGNPIDVQFDLFLQPDPATFGVNMVIRTGCAEFSHRMVTMRSAGGWLPDCYLVKNARVWDRATGEALDTPEESDVFRLWGMEMPAPEERTEMFMPVWSEVEFEKPVASKPTFGQAAMGGKLTMERAEQIVAESKQWALPLFGKETATRMASEAIAKSRG